MLSSGGWLKKPIYDNVLPFKAPQQASLFGDVLPENTNEPRFNPRRALLKFGVRSDFKRDEGDVPLAKAKQLGLGDEDEDRTVGKVVTDGVPLSERAILRVLEGSDVSGHRRATFNEEVHEAVEAFFHGAQALFGFDAAVAMLFSMLSGAPTYVRDNPPSWLLQLFADERELLFEVFHDHLNDRRIDPACPFDSDDEEE